MYVALGAGLSIVVDGIVGIVKRRAELEEKLDQLNKTPPFPISSLPMAPVLTPEGEEARIIDLVKLGEGHGAVLYRPDDPSLAPPDERASVQAVDRLVARGILRKTPTPRSRSRSTPVISYSLEGYDFTEKWKGLV
jgi:hypothetical protein